MTMTTSDKLPMAILLAAGAGSRFGGGKLLHPLEDGAAIAAHAARNLISAGLDFPLRELLEQEGCTVTVCTDAALGMGVSLAHGVRMTHDAAGWIVALADMPRIRPETIARVVQVLMAGADIVAPAYQGDRGHPVAFSRKFLQELQLMGGDSGARAIVQRNQAMVKLVDGDDPGVLLDIDRRSDLLRTA